MATDTAPFRNPNYHMPRNGFIAVIRDLTTN